MYKTITHFSSLSALRFLAAMLVVVHHAESVKLKYGFESLLDYSFFQLGGFAVSFFFVLSGFLITYLLLKEKKKTQTVSVKKFYVRRILRIWPLYYLLVFLGLLLIPQALALIGYDYQMPYTVGESWYYFVFFAPFMVNIFYGSSLLEPLWSIGVEEIFYLFWAPLFKFIRGRVRLLLLILLGVYLLLKILLWQIQCTDILFYKVLNVLKFESMIIGGLAAVWLWRQTRAVEQNWMFRKWLQVAVYLVIMARVFFASSLAAEFAFFDLLFNTPIISEVLFSVMFAYVIVSLSVNTKSIIRVNFRVLEYLGELSYGIYMYHMIVLFFMILLAGKTLSLDWLVNIHAIFYLVFIPLLLVVCYLSKRLFEDKFLRLKSKFN